jgi:hypothetical protein
MIFDQFTPAMQRKCKHKDNLNLFDISIKVNNY